MTMTKMLKKMLGIAILLFVFSYSNAQTEKYQSLFIYNFSKYIQWPDDMNSGQFVIGILGNSDVYDHLVEMANIKKKTQNMDIIVKKYSNVSQIEKCHILFVSTDFASQLSSVTSSPVTKSTLIITDKPGLASKGATINFVEDNGKIKFELNQASAEKRGLKVAGSLTALSILV